MSLPEQWKEAIETRIRLWSGQYSVGQGEKLLAASLTDALTPLWEDQARRDIAAAEEVAYQDCIVICRSHRKHNGKHDPKNPTWVDTYCGTAIEREIEGVINKGALVRHDAELRKRVLEKAAVPELRECLGQMMRHRYEVTCYCANCEKARALMEKP